MKENTEKKLLGFEEFQNIETKAQIKMTLEKKHIKKLNEAGFEDVREIELERDVEFGINDLGNYTEISLEIGSIKFDKAKFDEALRRYHDRNKFIKDLEN